MTHKNLFFFQIWLCGGVIEIHPCSHVGILQVRDDSKSDLISRKFICDAWLDRYKYQFRRRYPSVKKIKSNQTVINLIQNFQKQKQCAQFSWYLETIVKDGVYTLFQHFTVFRHFLGFW